MTEIKVSHLKLTIMSTVRMWLNILLEIAQSLFHVCCDLSSSLQSKLFPNFSGDETDSGCSLPSPKYL